MRSRRGVRWSEANRRIEAAVDNVRGLRVWGVRAENGRINGHNNHDEGVATMTTRAQTTDLHGDDGSMDSEH